MLNVVVSPGAWTRYGTIAKHAPHYSCAASSNAPTGRSACSLIGSIRLSYLQVRDMAEDHWHRKHPSPGGPLIRRFDRDICPALWPGAALGREHWVGEVCGRPDSSR